MTIRTTNRFTPPCADLCRLSALSIALIIALILYGWTTASARAQSSDPTYILQTTLPTAAAANAVVAGDLNNDGTLDLVVGVAGQNVLYLNDGRGHFGAAIPFGDSANTVDIGLGDLDNDGALDIIAYNLGAPSAIYANTGAGAFARLQTLPAATNMADRLALGDLDGDGDYDLVAAHKSGNTVIYANNGQGALQQTRTLSAGLNPVLLDVDANGALDITLIQPDTPQPNISRLVHFLNNGAGNFTATPLNLGGGQGFNNGFAMGDMDGDGDLDFVVSSFSAAGCGQQGCEDLRLLLNRGLLGYASVALDDAGAAQLTLVDLDHDGDLDIVANGLAADTALPNDLQDRVYLNQSISELTASATFTRKEIGAAPAQPHPLAVADFSADGQLDAAIGGPSFTAIYQGRNGQLFDACQTNPLLLDTELAVDINGDAYLDIILRSGTILRNDGAGGFSPTVSLPLVLGVGSHLAAADLNDDGRLDLVAFHANAPAALFLQTPNGQFSSPLQLDNHSFPATSLATGDVDGDGDLDLFIGIGTPAGSSASSLGQNRLYLNNGAGQFTLTPWPDEVVDDTQAVALGDLDGDGDLDLIVANSSEAANAQQGRQNYLYFNNGAGHFAAQQALGSGADRTRALAVGDVNSDGHLDIVAANYAQLNAVYLNDGVGGFAQAQPLGQFFDSTARILLVDLDHDRDLDIVAANEAQADAVFLNDGHGQFTASSAYSEPFADARLFTLQTGDFDRDGDLELVADVQPLSVTPYVADCMMEGRLSPAPQTADRQPQIVVQQPGRTVGAGPYASPQLWAQPVIPVTFTLFDANARPTDISAYYSLDGGGQWFPATPSAATITHGLTTQNGGAPASHTFGWDVYDSNFVGQSDFVLLRFEARPSLHPRVRQMPGPFRFPHASAQIFPIRVRGTQVRVVDVQGAPVAGAEIYRLPAGEGGRAALFTGQNARPVRTNAQGYLEGRGVLYGGDKLVALAPISATHAFTLYHSSAAPTASGLDAFVVAAAGIQTLTVSAANPLTLFNLDISLEWDARNDGTFLADLQNAVEKASDVLFDVSEGQAALGDVRVHQAKEQWVSADVILYASNSIHPRASMGGVVITPTVDIGIHGVIPNAYLPGQIHMGPHWDPFGQSEAELRQDWWLAFAHELSHYLFFLPDNYLGVRQGVLVGIDCQGSFMTNTYEEPYREFLTRERWDAQPTCATESLAAHTTGRADWETIQHFLPWMHAPASSAATNPGPTQLTLAVTRVQFIAPAGPTHSAVLPARNFDLRNASGGEVTRLREATAYLFKTNGTSALEDDYVIGLGSTGSGSDRIKVRGAQNGDRLCVIAGEAVTQLGCTTINEQSTSIQLQPLAGWQPEITVSPVTSRTLTITVAQSAQAGQGLHAQLLPAYGSPTQTLPIASPWIALQPDDPAQPRVFSGVITLDAPAFEGFVRVWSPNQSVAHEALTQFYLSPGWGPNARAFGGANSSVWGPNARAFGGANDRTWGAHQRFMNAPVASGDGRVTIFNLDDILGESGAAALQALPVLPQAPLWLTQVGQAYRFTTANPTDADATTMARTIAFHYLEREAPKGYEQTLAVYYQAEGAPGGGAEWQRLPTYLDTDENLAAAHMPANDAHGQGIYALMATLEMPALQPGWNLFGYPIPEARPVAHALSSLAGAYSAVYYHEPTALAWRLYDPAVVSEYPHYAELVNDLETLAPQGVYWLHATMAITPYLSVNVGDVRGADIVGDDDLLPPATFFGPFAPAGIVAPSAGLTLTASIQGVACGQGHLYLLDNQWVYKIQVAAAVQKSGCGAPGDVVTLAVGGFAITETILWDNRQAQFQSVTVTNTRANADVNPGPIGPDEDNPDIPPPDQNKTTASNVFLPLVRK